MINTKILFQKYIFLVSFFLQIKINFCFMNQKKEKLQASSNIISTTDVGLLSPHDRTNQSDKLSISEIYFESKLLFQTPGFYRPVSLLLSLSFHSICSNYQSYLSKTYFTGNILMKSIKVLLPAYRIKPKLSPG